jgi:hypothetical protein
MRGDVTQLYLSVKSRFCGFGRVVLFHGWRLSTALPSGSFETCVSSEDQSSKYELPSRIRIARLISTRSVVIRLPSTITPGVTNMSRPHFDIFS